MQGGGDAASSALMTYYTRLKTGSGQRVDISIQECVVWTLLNTTMAWQLLGLTEMRGGAVRKERANRFYTRLVWPCRDGHISSEEHTSELQSLMRIPYAVFCLNKKTRQKQRKRDAKH